MGLFSRRNGFAESNILAIDNVPESLKNRIWNLYYINEVQKKLDDPFSSLTENEYSIHQKILDSFGKSVTKKPQYAYLHNVFNDFEWFNVYDFIELHLKFCDKANYDYFVNLYNEILEEQNTAFRVIDGQVVAISNKFELSCINQAIYTRFEAVNQHMKKAIELLSDRLNPDYANAVKEAITSVESLVNIITESKGSSATLGNTVKLLSERGVYIHKSLEIGISKLYGYASDADGIRHGGQNANHTTYNEAKLLVVLCSAIDNFLISEYAKVNK